MFKLGNADIDTDVIEGLVDADPAYRMLVWERFVAFTQGMQYAYELFVDVTKTAPLDIWCSPAIQKVMAHLCEDGKDREKFLSDHHEDYIQLMISLHPQFEHEILQQDSTPLGNTRRSPKLDDL